LDASTDDGDDGLGVAKEAVVYKCVECGVECESEGDGTWNSGDGERVEKGEAKKASVFGLGGEEDEVDVRNVMSENVEDSEDALEPDERERRDAIPSCGLGDNIREDI
jgi:hypothetical protein